jgi:predicted nucleic acid-binding protein
MYHTIFDAGPLITTCKFAAADRLVIDHILERCSIAIAASVYREVVVAGKSYPDANAARQRIEQGQITVLAPDTDSQQEALIAPYNLGDGERDTILLAKDISEQGTVLIIDDHLAYLVCDRLGLRKHFLLDLIVELVGTESLDKNLGLDIVEAIRTRYPLAFVEHTRRLLKR